MKTLNNYITESIYGNLGLDDLQEKEFVRIYNAQSGVTPISVQNGKIIFRNTITIHNPELLINGHFPEISYEIKEGYQWLTALIDCSEFKSFENFPNMQYMSIEMKNSSVTDWQDLNAEAIRLTCRANGCAGFANIKPQIVAFDANGISPALLNTMKNVIFETPKGWSADVEITIQNKSITSKDLKNFFKNNKIKDNVNLQLYPLTITDFDFLDYIKTTIDNMDSSVPAKFSEDAVAGVFRNINKFADGMINVMDNKKFCTPANEYANAQKSGFMFEPY